MSLTLDSRRPETIEPQVITDLLLTLRSGSDKERCLAAEALGAKGQHALAALPALAEIISGPFPSEPGYWFVNRSALSAVIDMAKKLEPSLEADFIQRLVVNTLTHQNPSLALDAAEGLNAIAQAGKLNADSLIKIVAAIRHRDHDGVPNQSVLLATLLNASADRGLLLIDELLDRKVAVKRLDGRFPEEFKRGQSGDFEIDFTLPSDPRYVSRSWPREKIVVSPLAIKVFQQISPDSVYVKFDQRMPAAGALHERLGQTVDEA